MKVAYISSSEFGCPPPEHQIQAALWITGQIIEEMTRRGYQTVYVGAGTSTVKASEVYSMGPAFFDMHPYDEWIRLPAAEKSRTLIAYQIQLQEFLINHLQRIPADIVHFNTSPPDFCLPYAAQIHIPKVQTFHDPLIPSYEQIFSEYKNIKTNHYISISNAQRLGGPYISYDATIYNGIRLDDFPYSVTPKDGFVFLGRLKKIKGVKDAVQAALSANVSLTIAGRPVYTESQFFSSEVAPHIDGTRIIQLGVLGHEEKVRFLGEAKGLLFPIAWDEPFGLVMIEAMACGTPVIAYNRGSVSEIVKDGVTGFIIDPDDMDRPGKGSWVIQKQGIEGLKEAITRISEIDRAICRKHVEQNFTVEKMVDGYEKVYQKVLQ